MATLGSHMATLNASNSSALKGNLKALAATGGILSGGTLLSQAAIVYTDIADITINPGASIYFSLSSQDADTVAGNVNGGAQFRLYFGFGLGEKPTVQGSSASGVIASSIGYAGLLSNGTSINNSLTFGSPATLAYYTNGQWDPGDRGYLGLRFDNGGIRYGWADVSYNANSSLTLYGFGYESNVGSPILAGAVPEPATTGAIGVLFAGSVAALEARRRRKAAKLVATQAETNGEL